MVATELERVRFSSGGYDLRQHSYGKKSGPLGLLSLMTVTDRIAIQVWATQELKVNRTQQRQIESVIERVVGSQGVPAAAQWSLNLWAETGRRPPDVHILSRMLESDYREGLERITGKDIVNSIRKWR